MPKEDFTTYTEHDPGNDRIQKTAYHVDLGSYRSSDPDDEVYLCYDKGADHFGDFEHIFKARHVSGNWYGTVWGLSNLEDQLLDCFPNIHVGFYGSSDVIYLREGYDSAWYSDSLPFVDNTWYWFKVSKSGTSLTLHVYSDEAMENEVAGSPLGLTLHADHKFRYVFPASSWWIAGTPYSILDIEDLDLQEVQTVEPSSIASGESFGTPTLRYDQTISPTSIPSAESFGTPLVCYPQYLYPSSIPSAESFGVPSVYHYVGVTSYAVAACSYGSKVFMFRVGVDGHLYRRESSDNGDSWGEWVDMGDIDATADCRLACCFKSATEAIVLYTYYVGGSLKIYSRKWNGSTWSSAEAWTNSLNSITGIAVTYMGDWNVVVTGTDVYNRPGVWTCVYGDRYSAAVGTWSALNELVIAEYDSGISYHFPSLDMPDVFRIFFIESYSGSESYSMPFFTYSLPTADFIDNLWREPVPFNISSDYGINMAHYSGSVFLSCPFGYWSADLTPYDVDLTSDLTGAHLSLKPFSGELELTLRNDDGRYNAPAFTRGCDIRLRFGYRTPAGAETADYLPIVTIDSIERSLKKGRSEVILHALDGWSLLHNWIARYQYSWASGEKNVFQLLSFIFARAGIELSAYSTSSRVVDFYPAFTIHPGERGLTAVKRLLSLVEDVILFVGDVAYLIHPESTDNADYLYGIGHKVTECVMFESTMSINLALTHSEGIAAGDYMWSEIGLVYDRLSKEFDDNIATVADAHKFGEAVLREAELEKVAGSIIVPMNCAHDLYDVVELTVPHLNIAATLYRLVSIDYYWIPVKGTYNQRLLLSVV